MTTMTWEAAARHRLEHSGLIDGVDSPEAAARVLVGLQAQDLAAAGLAAAARCSGTSHADVTHRLYEERSLIKLWGQRDTLHLYDTSDWPLVFGAFGHRSSAFERSLDRCGVERETVVRRLDEFIEWSRQEESFGYEELRSADLGLAGLDVAALSVTWGDVCLAMERRAPVCHAEPLAGTSRFAHHDQWLPTAAWRPLAKQEAAPKIARRYIATYGPASDEDLAHWAGISTAEARRWLAACEDDLAPVDVDGVSMWLASTERACRVEEPHALEHRVRLLGKYDPLLLAHKSKEWLISGGERARVWRTAGRVEAAVLVDGRISGTWRYQRRRRTIDLTITPFASPQRWLGAALGDEAQRIADHFRLELGQVTITTED